jgi:hypothetical protein
MIGQMSTLAAWAAVGVLAGLVAFQLLLVAGRPLGEYAWGGAHRILPRGMRIASAVATLIYAAAALAILEAAGVTDLLESTELPMTAVRVLAVFFGIGIVMNAVSRSRKERVMAPVALVLAILFGIVGFL